MTVDDGQDGLLSRRRLLEAGAIGFAGTALLGADAFAAAPRGLTMGAKRTGPAVRYTRKGYRRSRFSPHVGDTVKLRPHGGAAVRARLAAVEDVAHVQGLKGAQDAYILRFKGPAGSPLPEGIVGVRHKRFGTLQLYITPGRVEGDERDYVAAINRRIPRGSRRR
jgi:hypothetical protein